MIDTSYETFTLSAGRSSDGLLSPGLIMNALALGAAVPSEDVGLITPMGPGRASVELARSSAARLGTPRFLPCATPNAKALFLLEREDDLPDENRFDILVHCKGKRPLPGKVSNALSERLELGSEELGFGLEGSDYLRVSLPLRAARDLPDAVSIDGVSHPIESLLKKP